VVSFPIQVKSNAKEVGRFLMNVHSKQIPFATAGALTSTAFDVRKELIDNTYPNAFALKNKTFPRVVTNVKKASKRNLVASVGNVSGRAIDYLSLHAEGGVKTPRGRSLAIPTKHTKRGAKGAVPKAQRPRALLSKKGAFITSVNGTRVIMQEGKRGKKAQVKYVLTPKAKIDKALRFFEDARRVALKVFDKNFATAFALAIRTEKAKGTT
jgi:hypothetical protein